VQAFSGCSALARATFPAGLTSIDSYAFSCCSALANVTFPAGLTSIDDYAFCGCSALTRVTVPDTATIGDEALFLETSFASLREGSVAFRASHKTTRTMHSHAPSRALPAPLMPFSTHTA